MIDINELAAIAAHINRLYMISDGLLTEKQRDKLLDAHMLVYTVAGLTAKEHRLHDAETKYIADRQWEDDAQ